MTAHSHCNHVCSPPPSRFFVAECLTRPHLQCRNLASRTFCGAVILCEGCLAPSVSWSCDDCPRRTIVLHHGRRSKLESHGGRVQVRSIATSQWLASGFCVLTGRSHNSMFGNAATSSSPYANQPADDPSNNMELNTAGATNDLSDWTLDTLSDKALDLVFVRCQREEHSVAPLRSSV